MHVVAVVAAGGQGTRLGTAVPKQFLELGGRSLLERSVAALLASPQHPPGRSSRCPPSIWRSLPPYLAARACAWSQAAPRRQDSVANAAARASGRRRGRADSRRGAAFCRRRDHRAVDRGRGRCRRGDCGAAGARHREAGRHHRDVVGGHRVRRSAAGRAAQAGARGEADAAPRDDLSRADPAGLSA